MGRTTPRALDGVVDGVRKSSEEQGKASDGDKNGGRKIDSAAESEKEREAADGKEQNGMQTFFTKVGGQQIAQIENSEHVTSIPTKLEQRRYPIRQRCEGDLPVTVLPRNLHARQRANPTFVVHQDWPTRRKNTILACREFELTKAKPAITWLV